MMEARHVERDVINRYLQTKKVGVSRENAIKIVSNELGVPEDFVRTVLKNSGLYCMHCGKFTTFDHKEAVRLYGVGNSIHKIAEMLGETYPVIRRALIRHGVKLKGKGGRKEYFRISKKVAGGAKVPVHASLLREMGLDTESKLYGIWIREDGKLKLKILTKPKFGAYTLTRAGNIRKDGKISTMNVHMPEEIYESISSEYGRWKIESKDTLVLEFK